MSSHSETTAAPIDAVAAADVGAEPDRPRSPSLVARLRAEVLAAAVTFGAFLAAWIAEGRQPFGRTPTAFNDEANQYAPIHTLFNRLIHGGGGGDLLFNWHSQYGVSFLPDFATYLTNPLSLPVFLVPTRDAASAELFVAPATLACAAVVMARYLVRFGGEYWWLRGLLGSGYGLCTWAVFNSYIPMWLWGLVSFPMLCIATDWLMAGRDISRRRLAGAALLFALAWYGNFYTAFIATLGAGLVLLLRLASAPRTPREYWQVLWRTAVAAAIGIGLTAPLVYPALKASAAATPAASGSGFVFAGPQVLVTELLPGTIVGLRFPPLLAIGVLGLLLAFSFPANARVARRARVVWTAGAVLLAASFQWQPASYVWHGLAAPHGNSYREAFVLCGVLVVLAWQSFCARLDRRALAVGLALFAVVLLVAVTTRGFSTWTLWAALSGVVLAGAVLAVSLRSFQRIAVRRVATGTVVCAVGIAAVFPVMRIDALRDKTGGTHVTASSAIAAKADAVEAVDGWPAYRTAVSPHRYVANEPMLVGGESADYYSSYLTQRSADVFKQLGMPSNYYGRGAEDMPDPVLDAIFSVGARVSEKSLGAAPIVARQDVPPLVTVHDATSPLSETADDNVFAAREAVLGYQVYQVPQMSATSTPKTYSLSCTPGTTVYWAAPSFAGRVRALGTTVSFGSSTQNYAQTSVKLGVTPASGSFEVSVTPEDDFTAPQSAIGCLDQARLDDAITALKAGAATDIRTGGHSVSATALVPNTQAATQVAVISTVHNSGWQCSDNGVAQGGGAKFHGLLAVRLSAGVNHIGCTYTPPGLRRGLAIAAAAGLGLIAVAVWPLVVQFVGRRRRKALAA